MMHGALLMNMKMKNKNLFVALTLSALFVSCLGDNNENKNEPIEYTYSDAAWILCSGAEGQDGSLLCYDYEKNALSKVAASVGVSPSDAFAYGNKLYVVGSGSNMIYVIDKKSQRTLASISTTQEMGEQEGADPRQIVAYGNNVFVTTGGGYVAVLDTTSFNISRTYKVGSRPEGMSVGMNASEQLLLYVANSDDGGGNPSISKINLATGSIDDLHFETLHNPRQLAVAGSDIYVLDWGYIDEDGTRKESGIYWLSDGSSRILTSDAVDMDAAGYSIVSCSWAPSSRVPLFSVENIYYGSHNSYVWSAENTLPTTISLDPNSGNIWVGFRAVDGVSDGYVNVYTSGGQFITKFDTGANPCRITFSYSVGTYTY